MNYHLSPEHAKRVADLKTSLPQGNEITRLLDSLHGPAGDEPSRDRYIALVGDNAVKAALKIALGTQASDRMSFDDLIKLACCKHVVTEGEAIELHRIREIRNIFAHSLAPISFSTPIISEVTQLLWEHPVTDWSSYFDRIFVDRIMFAVICGEFFKHLTRTSR